MSFMGSFFGGMAARAAFSIIALGGLGAYQSGALEQLPFSEMTGKSPSYFEMNARIVSVTNGCRLFGRSNGKLQRTEPMACPQAMSLLKSADFVGYEVRSSGQVDYIYYAPDGKTTLRGSISSGVDAQGHAYHKGGVVKIRVDAKDPRKSQII